MDNMFNTAVASAFTNVPGQIGGNNERPSDGPQLVYHQGGLVHCGSTNLFSLYCGSNGFVVAYVHALGRMRYDRDCVGIG
jgi:hypothetical protein